MEPGERNAHRRSRDVCVGRRIPHAASIARLSATRGRREIYGTRPNRRGSVRSIRVRIRSSRRGIRHSLSTAYDQGEAAAPSRQTMSAKRKQLRPKRRWSQLGQRDLATATAEFDIPDLRPGLPGEPLTASQRQQHARARRRGPGRPRIGRGSKTIALTIELDLLHRADAFAKRRGLKRAQLVAESLEALMLAS
jgi:hypothetical protein